MQFTLQATTLDKLSHWVPKLQRRATVVATAFRVAATGKIEVAARVNVDRDSASRLGISMADVDNALYNAFRTTPDFNDLYPGEPVPRAYWNIYRQHAGRRRWERFA
ncbi:hypothetical protein KCP69_12420 [Salmonella enterica subsp. enterica]|nr:hypothetical protein KCP69_12420 [Salmonella enterica subsp. enterica]